MRRFRTLLIDIVLIAILIGGLLAFWGLRSTNSQEDIPATIRVSKGQVSILDTFTKSESEGSGVLSLNVGQDLRVDAGSDAFLFYADGSVSRITGPAEVSLLQSQRTVNKPAILTSISRKLFQKTPSSPAETRIEVKARVVRGDVITRTAAPAADVRFELLGPGVIVSPKTADQGKISFAMTVPEKGDIAVEVGQGQVRVGMVSLDNGQAVPVIVPVLASKQGLNVTRLPEDKEKAGEVNDLIDRVDAAMPGLRPGLGPVTAEGIDFREVTGSDIAYFAGERVDGKPLKPAPAVVTRNVTTTTITERVITPMTFDYTITDRDIANAISDDFPGDPEVHILPGSVVEFQYWGMTYICSINLVDGRLQITGLPLGFDPPQIQEAIEDNLHSDQRLTLLSVVSSEGKATVTYTDDVVTTMNRTIDDQAAVPASLPHTSTYFRSISTPREISTDWKVVGSNALLAILIAIVVSQLGGILNSFVSKHEAHITRAYNPAAKAGRGVWNGLCTVGRALRWLSPGPFARAVWLMFIFGAVYSFLAVGKGLMGPGGLTVLLTLSFTAGFMALYSPWVKSFIARKMKVDARVGLHPGQLGVAIFSVGVSRGLAFKPGLMLGSPGGLKKGEKPLTDRQDMILESLSLVALVILAILAWTLVFFLPQIGMEPWAADFFKIAHGFVSGLQDWSLAIFAIAVQAVFFGLLPLPRCFGAKLMKKKIIIWVTAFTVTSFVFIHTMINKQGSIQDLTTKMIMMLIIVAIFEVTVFVYKIYQWRRGKGQPKGQDPVAPAA